MNDEDQTKVPPELDAAIDAVFAFGLPKSKRGRMAKAKTLRWKPRTKKIE